MHSHIALKRLAVLAALSFIGRLVHPGSENELKRYAREESALDELLGTDFSHIGQNALYEISDSLLSHKEAIEKFLRNNTAGFPGLLIFKFIKMEIRLQISLGTSMKTN